MPERKTDQIIIDEIPGLSEGEAKELALIYEIRDRLNASDASELVKWLIGTLIDSQVSNLRDTPEGERSGYELDYSDFTDLSCEAKSTLEGVSRPQNLSFLGEYSFGEDDLYLIYYLVEGEHLDVNEIEEKYEAQCEKEEREAEADMNELLNRIGLTKEACEALMVTEKGAQHFISLLITESDLPFPPETACIPLDRLAQLTTWAQIMEAFDGTDYETTLLRSIALELSGKEIDAD